MEAMRGETQSTLAYTGICHGHLSCFIMLLTFRIIEVEISLKSFGVRVPEYCQAF